MSLRNELLIIDIIVLLLIVVIFAVPSSILRAVLAVPVAVVFPGYAFLAALFPRRGTLATLDRIVLSIGVSIALVALTGLVLNFTPWGIRLESILGALAVLILTTTAVAWWRRGRLPREERAGVEF